MTFNATTARPRRRDGDQIANGEMLDTFANSRNVARHLVTQNHRFADAHGAKAAVLKIGQVGPANSTTGQRHQDFASFRF